MKGQRDKISARRYVSFKFLPSTHYWFISFVGDSMDFLHFLLCRHRHRSTAFSGTQIHVSV